MIKKPIIALVVFGLITGTTQLASADSAADLKAFQRYFKEMFPAVPFDDFANGIYALPAANDLRKAWEQAMESPPYKAELEKGKIFWQENNLTSCFKNGGQNIAQHYPYWDKKTNMVRTIVLDINECLKRKGKEPIKDLKQGTMAQVVAYMKSLSRGQRIRLKLSSPEAIEAYEEGKRFYWARRGQLNLSCASCHVDFAGKSIGGNLISPGLGHGVGFPAHRTKWDGLGTLHRRYAGCNSQVRAAPFKPQSRQYRHLEFYETYMQTGLPLTAPSQRF
ncbi:MAG: sulfur oxidation c-type cytochrome SoxA [Proteobacteria bacterium]|nr:MAG: sulfur oxidation c-type cytochrome SoxA [Pseudomonadota bacterium]TDJ74848.1 MAG: sulfur oxidation c-type cytochrome SoxA [Pseudomonadota bacterium]